MNKNHLRGLLLSNVHRLLITAEGLSSAMMEAFPLIPATGATPSAFFFDSEPPTYKELSSRALASLQQQLKASAELENITLTDDFHSEDIPDGSIAYHRIWGFITSDSRWYFSTKQFELDLLAAESNPAITCHFIHVNSPGGEAWYLDRLSETMSRLEKPVFTLNEQSNCSACYYITCHSDQIVSLTANDTIGCIGVMIETYDFTAYYEKLGIKIIREKAAHSDLKNKKYDDLKKGKPGQYIEEVLNPLCEQFLSTVKRERPALAGLPDDDPVFRGETFDTAHALDKGLIDGMMSFLEAVATAAEMGSRYAQLDKLKKNALNYV